MKSEKIYISGIILLIYISGIILLLVITSVLFWQNKLRKKAIQELVKANEMKSRFLGILNHDLRRPVAGLISYLQLKMLAPDLISSEESATFEKKTIQTAQNLLENMEELLFWCKDQMQTFAPEYKHVSVPKLFEDIKAFFRYEESVNIILDVPSDLKIRTDENYVKTIMRNLTSNAISASVGCNNPLIKWKGYSEGKKVILSIENNGGAISQDKIDILYNIDNGKNIKEGLGLKIIRDLSSSINCYVEVETDHENNTTTFMMIFEGCVV